MIAQKMVKYVEGSSVTRAMFEEGKKLAAKYGALNVYDFSLGNPSTPPPASVKAAAILVDDFRSGRIGRITLEMCGKGQEEEQK